MLGVDATGEKRLKVYVCDGCGDSTQERSRVARVQVQFRSMDGRTVLKSRNEGHRCFRCLASDGVDPAKLAEAEARIRDA